MALSAFTLSSFLKTVQASGLARTNRFEVLINFPSIPGVIDSEEVRLVSLMAEISNFPPLNIQVKPFKTFGPSHQRPISSEYGGDGISMTFHVDRQMRIKRFFDYWMQLVVNENNFTVNYQNVYAHTIAIRQLDEQENVTYEIELLEAFPRSMNLMELNNTAQNQTHRLNVVFAYRYWRPVSFNQEVPFVSPIVAPYIPTPPEIPFDNYTFAGVQDEYGNIPDVTGP